MLNTETSVTISRVELQRALSTQRHIGRLEGAEKTQESRGLAPVAMAASVPPSRQRFYSHPRHHRALLMVATSLRRYVADFAELPSELCLSRTRYEEYVGATAASWYYAPKPGSPGKIQEVPLRIGGRLDDLTVSAIAR